MSQVPVQMKLYDLDDPRRQDINGKAINGGIEAKQRFREWHFSSKVGVRQSIALGFTFFIPEEMITG